MKIKLVLSGFALVLIPLIYWQGLGGLFMLDDVANLQLLADTTKEEGFWNGVLGGHSGPTGRPLSLWTFALQQSSWPDDPASFKLVNVIIHLINSVLMTLIIYWLLPHLFSKINRYRFSIAVLLSVFWALLPIQISTVLYVIQRMVLLSSLFMLLAMLFYIWARAELCCQRFTRASVIFFLGVGINSLLAIFSKESGLLVFAFLLTIEIVAQHKQPISNTKIRHWLLVCLAAPLAIFVAYIIYKGNYQNYDGRTFNLLERILTQPRVLLDYLQQIILPVQSELGLYHDDYLKSTSLTSPISTLWAIVIWIAFFVIAVWSWFVRKLWIFFAFFWFVSGHLMESTILPLELYFEHRNYVSSMGVLIGLIGLAIAIYSLITSEAIQNIVRIGAIVYLCLVISVTISHVRLWGNKAEYMVVSAKEHPTSLRARMLMIDYYDAIENYDSAYKEIEQIQKEFPGELSIALSKLLYACEHKIDLSNTGIEEKLLLNGRFSNATEATLMKLVAAQDQPNCAVIGYEKLLYLVDTILRNKNYKKIEDRLLRIRSIIHFHNKDYEKSIAFLEGLETLDFGERIGLVRMYLLSGDLVNAEKQFQYLALESNLSGYQKKIIDEIRLDLIKSGAQGAKND